MEVKLKKIESKFKRSNLRNISTLKDKTATEVQELCGISRMMPISFDQLKKNYKIKIFGTDLSHMSSNFQEVKALMKKEGTILGMVKIKEEYANIYYNNNKEIDIPTQRFTIAHELAHCVYDSESLALQEEVDYVSVKENGMNSDFKEEKCDKFARDFLIPSDMLIKVCNIIPDVDLTVLSELFLVPESQMKIKLEEMNIKI